MTIVFEDHGQDFLEWDVDGSGLVTACRPFQEWMWGGCTVLNPDALERGSKVVWIRTKRGTEMSMKELVKEVRS